MKTKLLQLLVLFISLLSTISCQEKTILSEDMMVRIAEIEIHPQFVDEYTLILKEEAAASVNKETGVIAIFPMTEAENPSIIKIIEIYANEAAYKNHLETPHFKHYKTATLPMTKSLKLLDMNAIDPTTMAVIFKKI